MDSWIRIDVVDKMVICFLAIASHAYSHAHPKSRKIPLPRKADRSNTLNDATCTCIEAQM